MTSSAWSFVRLESSQWDPAQYLGSELRTYPDSYSRTTAELGDLAFAVEPGSSWLPGSPVVTPASVDPTNGRVVRSFPSRGVVAHQIADESLALDDILVPVTSASPALLVTEEHAELAFSTRFFVLRLPRLIKASWIWAVLNATRGVEARSALVGSRSQRPSGVSQLLKIRVPLHPSKGQLRRLEDLLPFPAVDLQEDSQPRSRWRTMDLEDLVDWNLALAQADEAEPERGVELGEIAEVVASPGVPKREHLEAMLPNTVPIWRSEDVTRGRSPKAWVPEGLGSVMVHEGDVLVNQIGPRHRVIIASVPGVLGSKVVAIRPAGDVQSDELAAYLASSAGQRRLGSIATGSTMPSLSLRALRSFRVPDPFPGTPERYFPEDRRNLSEKLEEALWG